MDLKCLMLLFRKKINAISFRLILDLQMLFFHQVMLGDRTNTLHVTNTRLNNFLNSVGEPEEALPKFMPIYSAKKASSRGA